MRDKISFSFPHAGKEVAIVSLRSLHKAFTIPLIVDHMSDKKDKRLEIFCKTKHCTDPFWSVPYIKFKIEVAKNEQIFSRQC